MICQTLDNFEYKWKLDTIKKDEENVSGPHKKARELLKNKYPTLLILEEVQIQVKRNKYLYLDFFLPLIKLAVEIQGTQHSCYIPFFHKNVNKYIQGNINDNLKKSWADLNNIEILYLYEENLNQ